MLSADSKLCANNEFVIYCAYWFRLQWPDKYLASLLEIQTGIWRGTTSPALLVHPSVFLPFFVLFFISIVHVWPRFATTTRMSWQRDWITRFCPADCFPGIPFPPDQKEKCEKLVRKCVHSRAHGFFLTAWGYKVDKNSIFWRLFSFTHVQFILPSNTKAHFSSRQKWGLNCALKLSICFRACLLHYDKHYFGSVMFVFRKRCHSRIGTETLWILVIGSVSDTVIYMHILFDIFTSWSRFYFSPVIIKLLSCSCHLGLYKDIIMNVTTIKTIQK